MEFRANLTSNTGDPVRADKARTVELGFLPKSLTTQCRCLIESYHELHGYSCLPDILWKSRLGQFIETQQEFQLLLRKASTTRSAKKSNESFALIATTILALEILASKFAGWSAIYSEAGSMAHAVLQEHARSPHMPLMEFYLYPPKYISAAAIAALAPPPNRPSNGAELCQTSIPELSNEQLPSGYAPAAHPASYGQAPRAPAALPT